jgi:hypothetical protein
MPEICAAMTGSGFELWDFEPSFRNPITGRLLQIDGIFTRPSFDRSPAHGQPISPTSLPLIQ